MAVSGGFLLAKKTAGERHCMRAGGNSDQLVRLANGGRLVDGDRLIRCPSVGAEVVGRSEPRRRGLIRFCEPMKQGLQLLFTRLLSF